MAIDVTIRINAGPLVEQIHGIMPTTVPYEEHFAGMRELGARMAYEQEKAFMRAFLADGEILTDKDGKLMDPERLAVADAKRIAAEVQAPVPAAPAKRLAERELLDELLAVAKLWKAQAWPWPDPSPDPSDHQDALLAHDAFLAAEKQLFEHALAGVEPPRRGREFL